MVGTAQVRLCPPYVSDFSRDVSTSSCPGLSRASTFFACGRKDVDGRVKPGDDGKRLLLLDSGVRDQLFPQHKLLFQKRLELFRRA
jgi:hypothetical protein